MEGPAIAREILKKLTIEQEVVEEICDIVGHHRSPKDTETLHFSNCPLRQTGWLLLKRKDCQRIGRPLRKPSRGTLRRQQENNWQKTVPRSGNHGYEVRHGDGMFSTRSCGRYVRHPRAIFSS